MKTVFFGTPPTAVPFLRLLASRTDVVAVISQPDRPSGRGLEVRPTPVKAAATELGLRVFQPAKPSDAVALLTAAAPEMAVVVAYGRILRADVLAIPRLGTMNAHFSLLPRWRGAAPVQWSLVRGDEKTGVTLFWLDEGMDTGPIQAARETEISAEEDAEALLARLTALGVALLDDTLNEISAGRVLRRPQTGPATAAPLIRREDARIDLNVTARNVHDLVRGFRMWPRAYLAASGAPVVQVLKTSLAIETDPPGRGRPGTILSVARGRGILVECGSCSRLWFLDVQPEGKKTLNAADFANGQRLAAGDLLPF